MLVIDKGVGIKTVVVLPMSPAQDPQVSRLLLLADKDSPLAVFCLCACTRSTAILELCLAGVPGFFAMVDAFEAAAIYRFGGCNDSKALGKGPVLKPFKGLFYGAEALASQGSIAISLGYGGDDCVDSGGEGRCHGGGGAQRRLTDSRRIRVSKTKSDGEGAYTPQPNQR